MSAECVRRAYGFTLKVGDRLSVDGRPGRLVSFPDQYLGVRFDGDKHTISSGGKERLPSALVQG